MESLQVKDYMRTRPVVFTAEMPVAEAVERILKCEQSGGPVLDEKKQVIGFLSEQDCISGMLASAYYRQNVAYVRDVMVNDVISVKPYDSVIELAQAMIKSRPRIYPVVDDDGILVGLITRHDIMAAIDHHLHDAYNMAS